MRDSLIEFFWDPASSYTYLASTQIEGLARRAGAALLWKPFVLGKAFEATGNRMPASVPAKGQYMLRDCMLWARHYGVPMKFPRVFPVNSILAMRCVCALERSPRQAAFAHALLRAYWVDDRDISQAQVVGDIAAALGLEAETLLAQAQAQPAKDLLRANTDEAIRRGVFGAPTFFVGEQMFWGNDRLPLLEAFLTGKLAA